FCVFFFQAEDGIRDDLVTGVQTCALPISVPQALNRLRESGAQRMLVLPLFPQYCGATTGAVYDQVNGELRRWRWLPELRFVAERSEERRVGKEWRSGWQAEHRKIGKGVRG